MIIEQPATPNRRFSAPIKICTPSPCLLASSRRSIVSRVSSISNSVRSRSRSASAVTSSSRFAWPRTIRRCPVVRRPSWRARRRRALRSIRRAAPGATSISSPISACASSMVRPISRAFKIIAGRDQRRRRQPQRHLDDPVLDQPVFGNQHDKRAAGPEINKLDMLERPVLLGRDDDPGAMRQPAQRARRLFQGLRQALAAGRRKGFRCCAARPRRGGRSPAARGRRGAAQPRSAAGQPRCAERIEQPRLFEIGHHVADRRRRQILAEAGATGCASRSARRSRHSRRRSGEISLGCAR